MKLQRVVILVLVLALVVGAEVALMGHLTGRGDSAAGTVPVVTPTAQPDTEATPTAQPQTPAPTTPGYTSPPSYSGRPNSSTAAATNRPTATNPPATDAPVTAPPTDPPTSGVGSLLASGNFASNTGVGLNTNISWTATELGGGRARITVNGYVNSYSLNVTMLPVSISFGGYSTTVTGNSVSVSSGPTSSPLFSTYFDVDSGTAGDMTVTWNFNGTYSETEIGQVVASGYVYTS